MSKNEFILSEWEKEKMDYLKEMARIKDAEDRGLASGMAKGIEQEKNKLIRNMHFEGLSDEVISKCAGLSISDVKKIIDEIV